MTKVFCFIPAFGRQISSTTFEATHALMSAFMQKGIGAGIATFSWPDIDEIRNMVLSFWYDTMPDSTHLLFIDADMGFQPQMVIDMITFGEPMVGAIYPKKTMPLEWVGSGTDNPDYRKGFIEVEALGMGCFLIRRDAITAMIKKFPEMIFPYMTLPEMRFAGAHRTLAFFDCMRTNMGKVSEDISFCRRYRETGGKVWASVAYQMEHVGLQSFKACFAEERQKAHDHFITKQCKHGKFTFNQNDTFIGASLKEYGEWCEFEIDLLSKMIVPGTVIIDAGANIGTHAIALAGKVGRDGAVYAFEPQPRLEAILRQNVGQNHLEKIIHVHRLALGNVNEVVHMADLPPDDTPFNFGGVPLAYPGSGMTKMATIDSFGIPAHLIKIDVEGMEAEVIRGAMNTIREHKPILYLECNGEDTTDVGAVLEEIGYVAHWSIGPYFNPKNSFGSTTDLWPTVMPSVNLLAIHASLDYPEITRDMPRFIAGESWRDVTHGQAAA